MITERLDVPENVALLVNLVGMGSLAALGPRDHLQIFRSGFTSYLCNKDHSVEIKDQLLMLSSLCKPLWDLWDHVAYQGPKDLQAHKDFKDCVEN